MNDFVTKKITLTLDVISPYLENDLKSLRKLLNSLYNTFINDVTNEFLYNSIDNFINIDTKTDLNCTLEIGSRVLNSLSLDNFIESLEKILSIDKDIKWETSLLSSGQIEMLKKFNLTEKYLSKNETIVSSFQEIVNTHEDKIALKCNDATLTFKQLDILSNKFANFLNLKLDIDRTKPIALMLENGFYRYISVYGILKFGGYYLPFETNMEMGRVSQLLNEAQCQVLFINKKQLNDFKDNISNNIEIICIEDIDFNFFNEDYLVTNVSSDSLAHMIFTSGSTGKPKGVRLEHLGIVNLCKFVGKNFYLTENDISVSLMAFSFDGCGIDLFVYLLNGVSVICLPDRNIIARNPEEINRICNENGVSVLMLPTAMAELFIYQKNTSLRLLLCGGEKLSIENYDNISYKIYNLYGPTECTIFSTFYQVKKDEKDIPIGKPIDNTKIYIVDTYGRILPQGAIGEVCISGYGVAREYYLDEEKTKNKFITLKNLNGNSERVYKTGDFAYWNEDGNIIYCGRKDEQVKFCGYRVELNEIKECVKKYPQINDCTIIFDKSSENPLIIAFYTSNSPIDTSSIIEHISKTLPNYMIPKRWIRVNDIPYTINGKIDKSKLLNILDNLNKTNNCTNELAQANLIKQKLINMFCSILKLNPLDIDLDDSFFILGGNSLLVLKLQCMIKNEFNLELLLEDLYEQSTINQLYDIISNN